MAENGNSIKEIKDYLGCETQELMAVWKTLTEAEKAEWKAADLSS